jgi:hypothetical protein
MSKPGYIGKEIYLRTLMRSSVAAYEQYIDVINNETILCIVEILINVVKGDIHLNQSEIHLFATNRSTINRIITTRTDYKSKKVLLKSHPRVVKTAVKVLLREV